MIGVNSTGSFLGSGYVLVKQIGSGSQGHVWLAQQRTNHPTEPSSTLGEIFAAKLLRPESAHDPDIVRRFVQERTLLMSLQHRNVIQTIDMVAEGDRLGIVMEFMPGGSLAEVLAENGTLPAHVAIPLMMPVLEALAYAHGIGVLHRDVKPGNVLLSAQGLADPHGVKLGDFGVASLLEGKDVHLTGLVGSPAYMSPELFTSGEASAASDIYAVGVMLYELLAGRTPFSGPGTAHTVGWRHVTVDPPKLMINHQLWLLIERLLAKQPRDRMTAREAIEAVQRLPETALRGKQLPVQVTPQWETSLVTTENADIPPAERDFQATVASRRPATRLRKQVSTREPTTVPDPDENMDAEGTVLGGKPGFEIEFTPSTTPTKRRLPPWLIILIGVVVLGLVISGVIWGLKAELLPPLGGRGTALTPAHLTGEPAATGLRIDLDATQGEKRNTTQLTLAITAPRSTALTGDVLVAIPPVDGEKCPTISETVFSETTILDDGVETPCSFKNHIYVEAGQSQTFTMHVQGKVGNDLDRWLFNIVRETREALATVTGDGFPLQRITGLTIQANSLTRTSNSPSVNYSVFAQWTGGEVVLFRHDTMAFQATDLLKSLTGGRGLEGVKVEACPETQVRGITVLANQSTTSCFIQATIGDLASPPMRFTINLSGG
jgi:serine/threonine-protein kinase